MQMPSIPTRNPKKSTSCLLIELVFLWLQLQLSLLLAVQDLSDMIDMLFLGF